MISSKAEAPTVGLLSLGCARNLVDSEVALGSLIKEGFRYHSDVESCDVAVINTCAFTQDAKTESIEAILRLVELKKKNKIKSLVVMGCLSQRYSKELADEIKEVDLITGADSFADLGKLVRPISESLGVPIQNVRGLPTFLPDRFLPKGVLTPAHFAYLKISEGCINACSYCAIPKMKGKHRSRPIEDVLGEAKQLAQSRPLREINLIGQDIAAYGYDFNKEKLLPQLVGELASLLPDVWIRLLYAHPAHVAPELAKVFQKHKNVCPYLDLPIEHSHPDMLKRMNRGVTLEKMNDVIRLFRDSVPNIALRTAIIVGFPGETEAEHQHLLDYMREVRFDKLGAFTYSQEEGTHAATMEDQIPEAVKQKRMSEVMELQSEISEELNEKRIGQTVCVLIEDVDEASGMSFGRSPWDAPEVDGQVEVRSSRRLRPGSFVSVKITGASEHDLAGEALPG